MCGGHGVSSKRNLPFSGCRTVASEALSWLRPSHVDDFAGDSFNQSGSGSSSGDETSSADFPKEPSCEEEELRLVSTPESIQPYPSDCNEQMKAFGQAGEVGEIFDWYWPSLDDGFAGDVLSSSMSSSGEETSSVALPNKPSCEEDELRRKFSEAVKKVSEFGLVSGAEISSRPIRAYPVHYNEQLKAFGTVAEVEEVLRLFNEMKESNCHPNVLCYNTVIDTLVMADRSEEARLVFEEMISSGVVPNVSSYNIMVKLHSLHTRRFDLAYEVILQMRNLGYCANSTTYSTLIAGLCRVGRNGEAWGVLDWMLEEKCLPTVSTYTSIVQGYCFEGRIDEAKSLMATMESVGCPPNSVTYNILIEALCKVGIFDEVERILTESEVKGWKPTVITYNTYMNGLCKRGMAKEAFELLEVMLRNGLYPNIITLNILLDSLCHESNVWEAKCLLERSSELQCCVGVVGYNTVMSRLCKIGRWIAVLKLLADMMKKGITPNTRTINIVIQSLCIGGKFRKAKCLVNSCVFVANVVTYNTIIHWFYQKGKVNEVRLLLSDMQAKKIAPDAITYAIMINGLCQEGKFSEATNYFIQSLDDGLSVDLVVCLVCKLIRNRRFKEILDLFREMERQGFSPDGVIFDSSIRAFCREGFCRDSDIFKVCLILDRMLQMR